MKTTAILLTAGTMILAAEAAWAGPAADSDDSQEYVKGALIPAAALRHPACQAAKRYSDLITAGHYDQIGSLFSKDALYLGPVDQPIRGSDKIGAFYVAFMAGHKAQSHIASLAPVGRHDCYMEMQGSLDTDSPAVIDRFTTDSSGKVVRLCIYFRPDRAKALLPSATSALQSLADDRTR